jgi:hypothetical protein
MENPETPIMQTDAVASALEVLRNLVIALRKHHHLNSNAEARAIIRQALMEL